MRRPIALPLIAVTLLAGCSATASPSTSTAPSASPRSGPSAMPSSPPTQSPSQTIAPSPTAQPSPSLPVVGQAPTGPWTSIRWIDTGSLPLGPTEVGVSGWSGGYVALEQSSGYDSEGSTEVPVVIRAGAKCQAGLPPVFRTSISTSKSGLVPFVSQPNVAPDA